MSSYEVPSSSPVPFLMARVMLSAGMFAALALSNTVRSRGFESGSPPPRRAAIVISRMSFVKTLPRFASSAPFLCLMVCHLECPDIALLLQRWVGKVYHRRSADALNKKSPGPLGPGLASSMRKNPGNVLLSHQVALTVPSAQEGLTAVFGMGTGVTPPPWSPG